MDLPFYAAMAMAFAPALVMMYALLRPYTYPATEHPYFSDPSFFTLFAVGLVVGTILFFVFLMIMQNMMGYILLAAIQVLVVVVCMNLKKYRGKSDSIFYGYGFGLGAGATTATGIIFDFSGGDVDTSTAVLFVLALASVFQYAAVGITVGEGIARHAPMQFAVQAMIYNVVFWAVFWIALDNAGNNNGAVFYMFSVFLLLIGALYMWYAYKKELIPLAREVDRAAKKAERKAGR